MQSKIEFNPIKKAFEYSNELNLKFVAYSNAVGKVKFDISLNNGQPIYVKNFSNFFRTKFIIENIQDEVLIIISDSFFWPSYICTFKNNSYEFFRNKGLNATIIKNGKQIGNVIKEKVILNGVQKYTILKNKNESDLLIFIFFLVLFKQDLVNEFSNKTYDFGYIGKEKFKFNKDWLPD